MARSRNNRLKKHRSTKQKKHSSRGDMDIYEKSQQLFLDTHTFTEETLLHNHYIKQLVIKIHNTLSIDDTTTVEPDPYA